ncbi:MAG: SH3 domain-containing protein, partial [Chloroflexota bacterium]|nr:SH3 domain-containing protein [Chloroflexota bacterium]
MYIHSKHRFVLLTALIMLILLSACGSSGAEPSATPTKTPVPANAQATNTPAPPTPTSPTAAQPTTAAASQPAPAAPQTQSIVLITTDSLNVRREPNATADILTTVNTGQTFTLIGRNQDNAWVQIGENNREVGWVSAEFVEIQTGVPVTQTQTQTSTQAGVAATPPPAANAPILPGTMLSPDFGGQAFLWWRPEIAQRDLKLMREGGFN